MTQEDKKLLLQDLCARLPYEIIVDIKYSEEAGSSDRLKICSEGYLVLNADLLGLFIEDEIYLKPYLRPMSSMTEEEHKEYEEWLPDGFNVNTIDWLNAHHFDYRGLIERGLAIEVTKENNPYED